MHSRDLTIRTTSSSCSLSLVFIDGTFLSHQIRMKSHAVWFDSFSIFDHLTIKNVRWFSCWSSNHNALPLIKMKETMFAGKTNRMMAIRRVKWPLWILISESVSHSSRSFSARLWLFSHRFRMGQWMNCDFILSFKSSSWLIILSTAADHHVIKASSGGGEERKESFPRVRVTLWMLMTQRLYSLSSFAFPFCRRTSSNGQIEWIDDSSSGKSN